MSNCPVHTHPEARAEPSPQAIRTALGSAGQGIYHSVHKAGRASTWGPEPLVHPLPFSWEFYRHCAGTMVDGTKDRLLYQAACVCVFPSHYLQHVENLPLCFIIKWHVEDVAFDEKCPLSRSKETPITSAPTNRQGQPSSEGHFAVVCDGPNDKDQIRRDTETVGCDFRLLIRGSSWQLICSYLSGN